MKRKVVAVCLTAGLLCTAVLCNAKALHADTFTESKTIWVIGDSIASDHNDEDNLRDNAVPLTGWGNVLQNFVPDDVKIENKARSGRSSRSYTTENVYKDVKKSVKAGDYVIVQFGHNDEDELPKLYTDPAGSSTTEESFKWYLKTYYIQPNAEKGARTILASSVVRCNFKDGKLEEQTHAAYATAMEELAKECQDEGIEVYYIDTQKLTRELYEQLGEEGAEKLHAVTGQEPDTQLDRTHYGPKGAVRVADIIAKELKGLGIECCQNVKSARTMDAEAARKTRTAVNKFNWK